MKKICVFMVMIISVFFVISLEKVQAEWPYTKCPYGHSYVRINDYIRLDWGPTSEASLTFSEYITSGVNESYSDFMRITIQWSNSIEKGIIAGWDISFVELGLKKSRKTTEYRYSERFLNPRERGVAYGERWNQIQQIDCTFVSEGLCSECNKLYESYGNTWEAHNQDEWLHIDWSTEKL